MVFGEADTRAKLIDPALHSSGWSEDFMTREELTQGAVEIINGIPKRVTGRTDYTLRIKISPAAQPVAIAIVEAKAENLPANHGLQQAKLYSSVRRLNVPFVYSSNGHEFYEYDNFTKITNGPKSMSEFPSPDQLRQRYEEQMGFNLDSESAKPLITPYSSGEGGRRYYQDAAIRAVFEKIAKGENRALLSLATGAGKTYIAVNLLKRIADAGQLKRALFLCDRDELRRQGLGAFQDEFGSDAAAAATGNPELNARVVIATYQTLGVDTEEGDTSFLTRNYPENYFSHIIIDECHRSAWGKWSEVLIRNNEAIQVGLTATPRGFEYTEDTDASKEDQQITADNHRYFGEPVYEYSLGQGIEDGYLAAMEIIRTNTFINRQADSERKTGLRRIDLEGTSITDSLTGEEINPDDVAEEYSAGSFEAQVLIPERIEKWCRNLFEHLISSGNPEQKTIIFCVRDRHADDVAIELNNIYAEWCQQNGKKPVNDYAFKCTAAHGKEFLSEIRGSTRHHFIATTVDLLTTGVDVPPVTNIVFFRYVNSPIAFYQMVGRGTRLHPPTNKLMFKVYDYTNATRLFGEDFITKIGKPKGPRKAGPGLYPGEPTMNSIQIEGIDVQVSNAGIYILTTDDSGETVPVTLDEYKQKLAAKLVEDIPSLDDFREAWVEPSKRSEMISRLPDSGRAPIVIRKITDMEEYDLYDVIADIGYRLDPKTMSERAESFKYKNEDWLESIDSKSADVIKALASQFSRGGTENLENPQIFKTPEVVKAGGVSALSGLDDPLVETKQRLFKA